jgi:hypothetical protein
LRSDTVFLLSICLFAEAIIDSLIGIVTHPTSATVLFSLEAEVILNIMVGIGAVFYWFSSRPDYSVRARPLGISILAATAFLTAVALVIEGLALLLLPIIGLLGLFVAGLGFGFYKLGRGIWDGTYWARQVMLVLTAIGIVVSLLLLPFYPNYGAPLLALFQFWYLRRPHVKDYFNEYDLTDVSEGRTELPSVLGQSLGNEWRHLD